MNMEHQISHILVVLIVFYMFKVKRINVTHRLNLDIWGSSHKQERRPIGVRKYNAQLLMYSQ